jgi:hypothetical protein
MGVVRRRTAERSAVDSGKDNYTIVVCLLSGLSGANVKVTVEEQTFELK